MIKKLLYILVFLYVGYAQAQHILLYTETSGFDHGTREEAETLLTSIAATHGWTFTVDNTGTELDNLSDYDVIWFSNTSGDNFNATERSAIEAFAAAGGHFVSEHAASDSYGHSTATTVSGNGFGLWDWWSENVTGSSVRNSPNHTSNNFTTTISITNANAILDQNLTFPRSEDEEWYYWEGGYLDPDFTESHGIASTGGNSYDAARMASVFYERPDGGRSWYTSQGHNQSSYTSETDFQTTIENGFLWVLENYYENGDGAPTDGLQARLRFDGDITDAQGNSVTQPDGTPVEYVAGLNGRAAVFTGADAIELTDTDFTSTEDFSVSVILKASADGFSIGSEISRATSETGGINIWSNGNIYFKAEDADLNFGGNGSYDIVTTPDAWYHFILTYDASTGDWTAYADGSTTPINSGTQAADATNLSGVITVGGRTDTNNEYLTGAVDMVGWWNKELSIAEVQQEFDAWASTADAAENQNQGGSPAPEPTGSFKQLYLDGGIAQVYYMGARLQGGSYNPPETDTEAPTVPGSLTNTTQTSTSLTYTWNASTDNTAVTGYEYELDDSGSPIDVGNVLTATPTGLTASTAYDFKVRAYDAEGNRSAYTANVQGTTDAAPALTGNVIWYVHDATIANDQTGTDHTIDYPDIVDDDDFLIAQYYKDIVTFFDSGPGGSWVIQGVGSANGGVTADVGGFEPGDRLGMVATLVADGTETGSISITPNNTSNALIMRNMYKLKGVDPTNPVIAATVYENSGEADGRDFNTIATGSSVDETGAIVDLFFYSENQGWDDKPRSEYDGSNTFTGNDGETRFFMGQIDNDGSDASVYYDKGGSSPYGGGIVSLLLQSAKLGTDWYPNKDRVQAESADSKAWAMTANNDNTLPTVWINGDNFVQSAVDITGDNIFGAQYVLQIDAGNTGSSNNINWLFSNTSDDGITITNDDTFVVNWAVRKVAGSGPIRVGLNNNNDVIDLYPTGDEWMYAEQYFDGATITGTTWRITPNLDGNVEQQTIQVYMSVKILVDSSG